MTPKHHVPRTRFVACCLLAVLLASGALSGCTSLSVQQLATDEAVAASDQASSYDYKGTWMLVAFMTDEGVEPVPNTVGSGYITLEDGERAFTLTPEGNFNQLGWQHVDGGIQVGGDEYTLVDELAMDGGETLEEPVLICSENQGVRACFRHVSSTGNVITERRNAGDISLEIPLALASEDPELTETTINSSDVSYYFCTDFCSNAILNINLMGAGGHDIYWWYEQMSEGVEDAFTLLEDGDLPIMLEDPGEDYPNLPLTASVVVNDTLYRIEFDCGSELDDIYSSYADTWYKSIGLAEAPTPEGDPDTQEQIDPRWPTSYGPLIEIPEEQRWYNAKNHIGERCTIVGPVKGVYTATESEGRPTFVDIGGSYPDDRVALVIWGDDMDDEWMGILESLDNGKGWIQVTGTLTEYDGVPEFTSNDPIEVKYLTDVEQ